MITFIAQIKLVSSKTLVSNDKEIEIKIRTNEETAIDLHKWQGEKLVRVQIDEHKHTE